MIEVENVSLAFGGNTVLRNISLRVADGETCGLIGPNGSGKTTLLNLINGIYHPSSGTIRLNGLEITNHPPHSMRMRHVARVFQIPKPWPSLTVLENVLVGIYAKKGVSHSEALRRAKQEIAALGLEQVIDKQASSLSGGQLKLLELARAFATDPSVMLLDEPTAGVSPSLRTKVAERIKQEKKKGTIILLVSHTVSELMEVCDRLVVLVNGTIVAEDKPEKIVSAQNVIDTYLGVHNVTGS